MSYQPNSGDERLPSDYDGSIYQRMAYNRVEEARKRRAMVVAITKQANRQGMAATATLVNKHYRHFLAWYEGRLSRGYLQRITGVRSKRQNGDSK